MLKTLFNAIKFNVAKLNSYINDKPTDYKELKPVVLKVIIEEKNGINIMIDDTHNIKINV